MSQGALAVPQYLHDTYWWAYVHPNAVRLFERQWLVNLILWGNFARLRDGALAALGDVGEGRTLQVACVYGDFTPRLAQRLGRTGALDVVDVLPIQLENLRAKLGAAARVGLHHRDASDLRFDDASYERVVLFFLLHEVPEDVRRRTLAEAVRMLKPGGRLVIVDYHRPARWHPLRGLMRFILGRFEPYALDLWARGIEAWLPPGATIAAKRTMWGGLYQQLIVVPQGGSHAQGIHDDRGVGRGHGVRG
jgi:ubiquinone/menaquinone biosynthesis C-methylase UbiE